MSDRHWHCVYFKYDNQNDVNGKCLLKNKEIRFGYHQCCDKIVLRPSSVLSYFLKHNKYVRTWQCSDEKAIEYLTQVKLNDYPKGE